MKMKIEDFVVGESIKILDVSKIDQGDLYWTNGDVVLIREVDVPYNRLEVWDTDKYVSEFIYNHELDGIEKSR